MDVTKVSNVSLNAAYQSSPQASAKVVSPPSQQKAQAASENVAANKTTQLETDSVKVTTNAVTSRNLTFVRNIEEMHVNMNRLAKGARETNEALVQVAEQARQMQGDTFAIIKNFPPFTRESLERQQILMSYISLEKEIVKMMVPPPPPPIFERIQHLWEATFGKNGQLLPSAVPSLQTDSSDQDVQAAASALGQLDKNIENLSSLSAEALIGR